MLRALHETGCLDHIAHVELVLLPCVDAEGALMTHQIEKLTFAVQHDGANEPAAVEQGRTEPESIERQGRGQRSGEGILRAALQHLQKFRTREPYIYTGAFTARIEERETGALQPQPRVQKRIRQLAFLGRDKGGKGAGFLCEFKTVAAQTIFVHPPHHTFEVYQGTVVAAILQLPELAGDAGRQSPGAEALHAADLHERGETRAGDADDFDLLPHLQVGERLVDIRTPGAVDTFGPIMEDKIGIAAVAQRLAVADHAGDADGKFLRSGLSGQ